MDNEKEEENNPGYDGPVVKIGQDEGIGCSAEYDIADEEREISCYEVDGTFDMVNTLAVSSKLRHNIDIYKCLHY